MQSAPATYQDDLWETWHHGTRNDFDELAPGEAGGFHFGTQAQAQMRAGKKSRILTVRVRTSLKLKRLKDTGSWTRSKIASAKRSGYDGIVYLNRYEGIPFERVQEAQEKGIDLDRMSDARFRKFAPEMEDSIIIFNREDFAVTD